MPQGNWICAQLPSQWSRAPDPQLLSSTATTTEVHVPKTHFNKRNSLQQEKPPHHEKRVYHNQRRAPDRCNKRKPVCSNEDPAHSEINKYIFLKNRKRKKKQEKNPPRILYFNCVVFPCFFTLVTDHTHKCEYFNSLLSIQNYFSMLLHNHNNIILSFMETKYSTDRLWF